MSIIILSKFLNGEIDNVESIYNLFNVPMSITPAWDWSLEAESVDRSKRNFMWKSRGTCPLSSYMGFVQSRAHEEENVLISVVRPAEPASTGNSPHRRQL